MLFESIEKKSKDIIFVYTMCSNRDEARSIGLSAINNKIAISADYWIVDSIYPWRNVIQEADQYMLMFATQKCLSESLVKHIETEHSYSVPVIAVCETKMTNQTYSFWVDTVLSSEDNYITETEAEIKKRNERGYHYDRLK